MQDKVLAKMAEEDRAKRDDEIDLPPSQSESESESESNKGGT